MSQDSIYLEAADEFGSALERLAQAYERDSDARRDLLQEIHLQLWRSCAVYDGRCSLRTWTYRVAHNVATRHAMRQRRLRERLAGIEEIESAAGEIAVEADAQEAQLLEWLYTLIGKLKPVDRQILISWLEGMDAKAIGEITGLSAENVATKVHRIKKTLRLRYSEGEGRGK